MGINYRYETSLLRRHSYNYSYLWQQRSGWPRLLVLISPRLLLEREWLKWLLKAFYCHIYNPEDLFNTHKPFEPLVFKTCISKTSKRPPVPLKRIFENDFWKRWRKWNEEVFLTITFRKTILKLQCWRNLLRNLERRRKNCCDNFSHNIDTRPNCITLNNKELIRQKFLVITSITKPTSYRVATQIFSFILIFCGRYAFHSVLFSSLDYPSE